MKQWEYAIIPISFKDYPELINYLDGLGKDGWIVGERIKRYKNSPEKGYITLDFICRKPLKK